MRKRTKRIGENEKNSKQNRQKAQEEKTLVKTPKVARTRLPDLEGPQTGASQGLPQVLGTHTMTPYESRAKMDPSTLRIIHSDFSHFFFFSMLSQG